MTDNNKTLVSAGHELASELKADCGAVDVRSVANLLTELASALDVQSARSDALSAELKQSKIDAGCYKHGMEQSNKRLTEIAAENAALKSGQLFFMYSDETGFEIHKSQERAIASAKDMIAVCREEAVQDGWPEDADTICWGVIMQKAIETNFEKPSEQNGWIGWSEYNLNPELETPATDAFSRELQAQGVEAGIERVITMINHQSTGVSASINVLRTFAAQLRGNSNGGAA